MEKTTKKERFEIFIYSLCVTCFTNSDDGYSELRIGEIIECFRGTENANELLDDYQFTFITLDIDSIYEIYNDFVIKNTDISDRLLATIKHQHDKREEQRKIDRELEKEFELNNPRKDTRKSGYIYLLESLGKYKIGLTKTTVEQRMSSYTTQNPHDIVLITSKKTDDCLADEKELLEYISTTLKKRPCNGKEWFIFDDKELELIKEFYG